MIQRLFPLAVLFTSLLHAVVLDIHPSKDINVTDGEIDTFINRTYRIRGIKPTREAAKKVIYENKLLANEYLKKFKRVPKSLLIKEELEFDEQLANDYVKKNQDKIRLSEDVLKSYYIAHMQDFVRSERVAYYPIEFHDFQNAYKFYSSHHDDLKKVERYAKLHNIRSYTVPKNRIFITIRELFKDVHSKILLPPVFLGDKFVVFYVHNIFPKKQLGFNEVKDQIRKKLLERNFVNTRKKILKTLIK